ncbi:MAG: cryptochrome/photolyase family protein [Promethearchaeota archaeon]|nr:MAG: cryptochrome/photolyase family protein [Candidatus Lokiarchaeota archaeon]
MKEAVVLFPHQLFEFHPGFASERVIYMVEDSLFFHDPQYPVSFHKKKLIFHRATMQCFKDYLIDKGHQIIYIEHKKSHQNSLEQGSIAELYETLKNDNISKIHVADLVDYALEMRLEKQGELFGIEIDTLDSPGFLCKKEYVVNFFKKKKSYSQTSFYIAQRKRLKILTENGKALGGKWSYDAQNRKKLPKGLKLPDLSKIKPGKYVIDASTHVENLFPDNPGSAEDFFYPIEHESARSWLKIFLEQRLHNFGPYEDAISKDHPYIFHSLISPLINVGLLTPKYIIDEVLKFSKKNRIPLNSLEGFIRQIIGWREFMRAIYELEGVRQRNLNYWNNEHLMPKSLYDGTTGILPVDKTVKKLLKQAYVHHIERLMILGNFMVLCEIHPDEVYQWFMELFIDAYDWVMVPNVYGMSLNADGGLITTKPYISSSNYIRKMSDYPAGEWCKIWDGLYWRFIHIHRDFFEKNPRMRVMTSHLDKMGDDKLKNHIEIAENFLKKLHYRNV